MSRRPPRGGLGGLIGGGGGTTTTPDLPIATPVGPPIGNPINTPTPPRPDLPGPPSGGLPGPPSGGLTGTPQPAPPRPPQGTPQGTTPISGTGNPPRPGEVDPITGTVVPPQGTTGIQPIRPPPTSGPLYSPNNPKPPHVAQRIGMFALRFSEVAASLGGIGFMLYGILADSEEDPPQLGDAACLLIRHTLQRSDYTPPQDTVNRIAPAALQASDPLERTTLNPLPGPSSQWFRTAAGECRKWTPEEKALIKVALKKRKQMREAYMRKFGCNTPRKICYKIMPNGSRKRCMCH